MRLPHISVFGRTISRVGSQMMVARFAMLSALALSITACDTAKSINPFAKSDIYKPEIIPVTPAAELYNEGLAKNAKGDFESAYKTFDLINRQHPGTQWAQKALIMQTYSAYEGRRYDDSANSATRYIARYANAQDAAYAQYLLAMSYYKQVPDVTRDQAATQKAVAAFDALIQRYPHSEYTADAKFKVQVVRDQLAGHEMEVGRFYLKQRNYTAAINRFREVVAHYQTTREVEEALLRLTEAYAALGIMHEAQTAAAVLGHNFPDSSWYKDAYVLLAKKGLEPHEHKGSWLSKIFDAF